jgi:hypothetical protein
MSARTGKAATAITASGDGQAVGTLDWRVEDRIEI